MMMMMMMMRHALVRARQVWGNCAKPSVGTYACARWVDSDGYITSRSNFDNGYSRSYQTGSGSAPTQGKSWYREHKKAVVLLSGGLDSATTLALAKRKNGFDCYSLAFDYGQRHRYELVAAQNVAHDIGVKDHRVITIDLRAFGGSALTSDTIDVPKDRDESVLSREIPRTYVPARNIIFLSYALAYAETIGSSDIFIGVNVVDYSGYPDFRQQFFDAYTKMARLGTRAGIEGDELRIHTPIMNMSKSDIIRVGITYDVDFSLTHSCYDPDQETGRPCEHCDPCLIRKRAFAELGFEEDPALAKYKAAGAAR